MAEVIDISDDDVICEEPSSKGKKKKFKCLNPDCRSEQDLLKASISMRRFYGVLAYEKKTKICVRCSAYYKVHSEALINSVRTQSILLTNPMSYCRNTVVLSDSESDLTDNGSDSDETEFEFDPDELYPFNDSLDSNTSTHEKIKELIGNMTEELGLKRQISEGMKSISSRLLAAEEGFKSLDSEYKQIERSLDSVRNNFYEAFRQSIRWEAPIDIGAAPRPTPHFSYTHPHSEAEVIAESSITNQAHNLPPLGPLIRTELKPKQRVYSIKHSLFSRWVPACIVGIEKRDTNNTVYQIRYFRNPSDPFSSMSDSGFRNIIGRNLAYFDPCPTRIEVGVRVIARYKDEDSKSVGTGSFFVGIVAEIPNVANKYRYLIFFDDGYAQYVTHYDVRVVTECSFSAWEDVASDSREFIKDYLHTYPERPMVRLQKFNYVKTEWNGRWWKAQVLLVDGSLVKMYFPLHGRTEWIYRGSTRLSPLFNKKMTIQAQAEQPKVIRRRTLPYNRSGPVVEYVNFGQDQEQSHSETQTERRAVARKSTSGRAGTPPLEVQEQMFQESRGFSRRKAISHLGHIFVPHQCQENCLVEEENAMKQHCSPLLRPMLASWRRQICKQRKKTLTKIFITYIAPCGRRLRCIEEVFRYLRLTQSNMEIDFFSFSTGVDPLSEWEVARKNFFLTDISNGVEKIPISCVNSLDKYPPKVMVYCSQRQPIENVNLNLDADFLVCCDCEDDCQDKTRCECWQLTLEAMKVIGHPETSDIGYRYRRLHEQVPTGIYECNSRCKCKTSCLNRMVQFPLRQKLQLFKTARRGWGVRTLHDIPQGGFICVYVGKVLSEAVANEEGKMTLGGDDYYAELDFIEVVEGMKEGYESDVEENEAEEHEKSKVDSNLGKKQIYTYDKDFSDDEGNLEMSVDTEDQNYSGKNINDLKQRQPSARIQARAKRSGSGCNRTLTEDEDQDEEEEENANEEENDQQERRPQTFEPRNLPQLSPSSKGALKSAREMFGPNEAVYIMDAKFTGNIGRYFNHSCQPNIFVQNVFVDTHDIRFPWVAFFASANIRAGTELTWDYNYEVGSVCGKIKYCYCMAKRCRGRLL